MPSIDPKIFNNENFSNALSNEFFNMQQKQDDVSKMNVTSKRCF